MEDREEEELSGIVGRKPEHYSISQLNRIC